MHRPYARSERGSRVEGAAPVNYGPNVTVIGAIRLEGIVSALSFEGALDGELFLAYTKEMLATELRPGDVVVMDNLASHKVVGVREAIEATGASLLYLPPYSPDLNPIEKCWSKVKHFLRSISARTKEALYQALAQGFDLVTKKDLLGWFKHCGFHHANREPV